MNTVRAYVALGANIGAPVQHLRAAVVDLATLPDTRVDWTGLVADYDRIRDDIESVFPIFKDYNRRIREPGGFHLDNAAAERVWRTPVGRALLSAGFVESSRGLTLRRQR